MTTPQTNEEAVKGDWRERFDKLFYQKDRVWMSRGGESYGSVTPEMGRGELFRFITSTLSELVGEVLQKVDEVLKKEIKIEVIKGVEGYAVYIDDYRMVGSKPWGGGTSKLCSTSNVKSIQALSDLLASLEQLKKKMGI